jgi:hypothetical protein
MEYQDLAMSSEDALSAMMSPTCMDLCICFHCGGHTHTASEINGDGGRYLCRHLKSRHSILSSSFIVLTRLQGISFVHALPKVETNN